MNPLSDEESNGKPAQGHGHGHLSAVWSGGMNRRGFLSFITAASGALIAVLVLVPLVGFVLGPILRRRRTDWRAVGPEEGFTRGDIVKVSFEDAAAHPWAGRTGRSAAWLKRSQNGDFVAFALDCTHLGCPVRWEAGAQLFMCPCHGGVYYSDGRVAGGPPPRPLTRYPVRVRGGQVEILTEPLPIT
jgi:menaquinol-cytochrome c reductase iron-sulfur subunit